jgi:hypothetical protein
MLEKVEIPPVAAPTEFPPQSFAGSGSVGCFGVSATLSSRKPRGKSFI